MARPGTLPFPSECRVFEGISSLKCPLFSHSYLPMNSVHCSLQIVRIAEVTGSSFCVHTRGDRVLTTNDSVYGVVICSFVKDCRDTASHCASAGTLSFLLSIQSHFKGSETAGL